MKAYSDPKTASSWLPYWDNATDGIRVGLRAPLYNFKTIPDTATAISHSNVLANI